MDAFVGHDRPLYGRVSRAVHLHPLTVAGVARLLRLDAASAFETYLVSGGFPRIVRSWARGMSLREFVVRATRESSHPLVFTGHRMVQAELPGELNVHNVLLAIGAGETTYSRIERRSGVRGNTLTRALDLLQHNRIVIADDPLSARSTKNLTRYTVADPYLRFWLRLVGPRIDDIDRGRGDLVATSNRRRLARLPGQRCGAARPRRRADAARPTAGR